MTQGSGEGLWGDEAAGLRGHSQLRAGVVQPQSTGGGKAPGGNGILGDPTGPAYPQDLLTGSGHGGGAWALSTGAGQRAWG